MRYPLDPKAELMIWGPTPSYAFVRIDTCGRALFQLYPKLYPGYSWSKAVILTGHDRFAWIHEQKEIEAHGQKLFIELMLPKESRELVRDKWKETLFALQKLEQEIVRLRLGEISDQDLLGLWNGFHHLTDLFWAHASLPELSNYGSAQYLKEKLNGLVPQEEVPSVMEILTAPLGLSFYQKEEIELSETNDMEAHQRKYLWLRNNYANVEVLPVSFFEGRKHKIPNDIRKRSSERIEEARERKSTVQKKYHLSTEIHAIAEAIADGIVWQDARKGDIWEYLHYENLLIEEIEKRTGVSRNLIEHLTVAETGELMQEKVFPNKYEWRLNGLAYVANEQGDIAIENSEVAREYWKLYVDKELDDLTSEFRGVVASKGAGTVQGKARIVFDPYKSEHLLPGEILVTTMTTSEFVFFMKRAAAIVTDTGGLTSHAAIVSRELGIPCIVGTKVATRTLRDGDLVEVDAEKGIVRKL